MVEQGHGGYGPAPVRRVGRVGGAKDRRGTEGQRAKKRQGGGHESRDDGGPSEPSASTGRAGLWDGFCREVSHLSEYTRAPRALWAARARVDSGAAGPHVRRLSRRAIRALGHGMSYSLMRDESW